MAEMRKIQRCAQEYRHGGTGSGRSDAIHFATAVRVKGTAPAELVFVGSDQDLVRASESEGFEVLNPEDSHAMQKLKSLRQPT